MQDDPSWETRSLLRRVGAARIALAVPLVAIAACSSVLGLDDLEIVGDEAASSAVTTTVGPTAGPSSTAESSSGVTTGGGEQGGQGGQGGGTGGAGGTGGCNATTCQALGKDCGTIDDGCGSPIDCGVCTLPETCEGDGTPNVCAIPPCTNVLTQTDAQLGAALDASRPVFAAATPSGGTAVAWTSQGGGLNLSRFDAAGAPVGAVFTIPTGVAAHGIAVTADGYALLVQRDPDVLALVKINLAGTVVLDKLLTGMVDHAVVDNEWYSYGAWLAGGGRLAWTGTSYATYFPVQRLWPDLIAHYGDTLRYYQPDGTQVAGGWTWGCSHSLDVRLSHNGATLGPVCLSDCYPEKGILYDLSNLVSSEPSGDCAGTSLASLGGLVPVAGGFWLTYASPEGQVSADIGLAHVSGAGVVLQKTWLTQNAIAEDSAHLATFEGGMLAGWRELPSTPFLLKLDSAGSPVGAPVSIPVALRKDDDFVTYPNGDVGWVLPAGSQVTLVRYSACP